MQRRQKISVLSRGAWVDRALLRCRHVVSLPGGGSEEVVRCARTGALLLRRREKGAETCRPLHEARQVAWIRAAVASCGEEMVAESGLEGDVEVEVPPLSHCALLGRALCADPELPEVHPVLNWIEQQRGTWDGVDRLFVAPFVAKFDPTGIADEWLWKLMLEILHLQKYKNYLPSADESLLLVGPRRVGKTSLPSALLGCPDADTFVSTIRDSRDVKSDWNWQAICRGAAAVVLDECSALKGVDTELLRSRLTASVHTARSLDIQGDRNSELRVQRQGIYLLTANDRAVIPAEVMERRIVPLEVAGPNPEVVGQNLIERAEREGDSAVRLWLEETAAQRWAQLLEHTAGSPADARMLPVVWGPQRTAELRESCAVFCCRDGDDLQMAAEELLGGLEHVGLSMEAAGHVLRSMARTPRGVGEAMRAAGWKVIRPRAGSATRRPRIWVSPVWDGTTMITEIGGLDHVVPPAEAPAEASAEVPAEASAEVPAEASAEVPAEEGAMTDESVLQQFSEPPPQGSPMGLPLGAAVRLKQRVFHRPNHPWGSGCPPIKVRDQDVTELRASWLEWDDLSLLQQWDLVRRLPLPPTAVLWTGGKSLHVYWEYAAPVAADAATVTRWREVQRRLAQQWGGDAAVSNPSRLMAHPHHPHSSGRCPLLWRPPQARPVSLDLVEASLPPPLLAPAPVPAPAQSQSRAMRAMRAQNASSEMCWGAAVKAVIRPEPDGSGTWCALRGLVWSAMDTGILEMGLAQEHVQRVLEEHLSAARPRDASRVVQAWEPGRHGAGTFLAAATAAGLPRLL